MERRRRSSVEASRRERLESTSLRTAPVTDDNLEDHHQHRLLSGQDPLELKYRLYAVVVSVISDRGIVTLEDYRYIHLWPHVSFSCK